MRRNDNILNLVRERDAEAVRDTQRGMVLQPGAIGDCVLTLPLVKFMKEALQLGEIDLVGHTQYIGIFPGRTCVDRVRSMDSLGLHRLFTDARQFDLSDDDPLIRFFGDYTWIVTFLGEVDSDFEQNLIFTAHCSRGAEVITVSPKPCKDFGSHVSNFYTTQFVDQCGLSLKPRRLSLDQVLLKPTEADANNGRALLADAGLKPVGRLAIIQPGSGAIDKCWHLSNFLAIAENLIADGIEVVFLLGPTELERLSPQKLNDISSVAPYLTDLSLTQVLELLSCADVFIGNDSGITHIAAGLGLATAVVFGPTNHKFYRPIGPNVRVVSSRAANFAKRPSPATQKKLLDTLLKLL